jgi:replicative DNA helicase
MSALSFPPTLRPVEAGERPPPASIEAEQACIGAVLLRQEVPPDFEDLGVDDFFLPAHRAIWEAILRMSAVARKVDSIALQDELRIRGDLPRLEGGVGYLVTCASAIPHLEGAGRYADLVREKARLRQIIQACAEIQARAFSAAGAVDDLLGDVRESFARIENGGRGQGPVRVGDEISAALDVIESRAANPDKHSVQTGLVRFDSRIGGLIPERLICVAAPPGMGKSAWVSTVAANASRRGIPCLIVSLEMARQEIHERLFAGEGKLPLKDLVTGEVVRDLERASQLLNAARSFADDPLFVDDRDSFTIGSLVGTVRRWYARQLGAVPSKENHEPPKPALVAVDYLQLIDDENEGDNRNLAIGRMTRSLKKLAKALRIPVVMLSQLNREHAKRGGRPKLSDLRDSGAIEADSDMVIFPWREAELDEHGRERRGRSGPAEWLVAKNRNGPTGAVPVWWAAEYTRFENLDASQMDEED